MAGTITLELTGGGIRPLRMIGNNDLKVVCGRFTFDSLYLTGGESMAPSDIGLTEITTIIFTPALCSTTITGVIQSAIGATYDYTNKKVLALVSSGSLDGRFLSEPATSAVLNTFTTRFIAFGY